MMSKYIVEKWKRKSNGMVHVEERGITEVNVREKAFFPPKAMITSRPGLLLKDHIWVHGPTTARVHVEVCDPCGHQDPHRGSCLGHNLWSCWSLGAML